MGCKTRPGCPGRDYAILTEAHAVTVGRCGMVRCCREKGKGAGLGLGLGLDERRVWVLPVPTCASHWTGEGGLGAERVGERFWGFNLG